jgi:two-component system LytT family sensor kinase
MRVVDQPAVRAAADAPRRKAGWFDRWIQLEASPGAGQLAAVTAGASTHMPESGYPRLSGKVVFGAWTLVGVLLIIQTYVSAVHLEPFTLEGHLYTCAAQLYRAWMWAALTPFVFWLRRYLARNHPHPVPRWSLHLLASVAIFVFGNVVRMWILFATFGYFRLEDFSPTVVLPMFSLRTLVDLYIYWIVFAVGYALDTNHARQLTSLNAEALRTQLANAELTALRQQIQPHFLFNSHNAIAALIREGQTEKAVDALTQLSALLRQSLEHGATADVELWRELDHVHSYLEIEKVRFEERLVTKFDVEEECLEALVPSLILQPLVENAVKHGISHRRNPGLITIGARRDGARLRLTIENDPAEIPIRGASSSGVGLSATRARLQRLFGASLEFTCEFNATSRALVAISIPFRRAPSRHDDSDPDSDR